MDQLPTDQTPKPNTRPGPVPLVKSQAPYGLQLQRRAIPGVTEVIVVASGKGGVGKSTVSVNLAVTLASQGFKVGLLDADIYGPSAPMMLGVEGPLEVQQGSEHHGQRQRPPQLLPKVAHGIAVMSFGFLTNAFEPVIWRGPMIAKAFRQFCYDVAWGNLDYLVIDLPPGTGDIQLSLIENVPIHGALIVTTPQDVALLDAHKALTMFQTLGIKVLGLVENMSHHQCSQCGHLDPVFGAGGGAKMASERGLDLLTAIPLQSQVRFGGDSGVPIAASIKVTINEQALDHQDPNREALRQKFVDLAVEVRRRL